MDLETLQKKYDRLLAAVRKMRCYQKEYFRHRASADLDKAKRWERQVDQLIAGEVKAKNSKQKELF